MGVRASSDRAVLLGVDARPRRGPPGPAREAALEGSTSVQSSGVAEQLAAQLRHNLYKTVSATAPPTAKCLHTLPGRRCTSRHRSLSGAGRSSPVSPTMSGAPAFRPPHGPRTTPTPKAPRRRERRSPRSPACPCFIKAPQPLWRSTGPIHETSEPLRPIEDPEPANDPDASFGHAKRNAPGAKDYLFFGYYAGVATSWWARAVPVSQSSFGVLPQHRSVRRPRRRHGADLACASPGAELPSATCWPTAGTPTVIPRPAAPLALCWGRSRDGPAPGRSGPPRHLRGCYSPPTARERSGHPRGLLRPRAAQRVRAKAETARRMTPGFAELIRYKFSPLSAPDDEGYQRVVCPAAAGKVRCPHKVASLALSWERPSVSHPPAELPRCCAQKSITVAPQVNEKTRQKHDYAGPVHRDSYARRTAAERTYASLADPSVGGIRRGWCRLFGRAKNTARVRPRRRCACNVGDRRVLWIDERHKRARSRRQSARARRRRRRYEREAPAQQPVHEVPTAPG